MPNHITNSTFEGQAGASGVAPTGWSIVTSTPDVNQDGGFEWANNGYMPSNLNAVGGTNYLTLFAQSSKVEAISTTLNTSVVAGQTYTFSVSYYVNDTNGTSNQGGATTFEIVVGTQVIQIPLNSVGVTAPFWQTTSVNFTASASTSNLVIRNTTDAGALNSYTGIALDNLVLERALDFVVEGTSGADLIDGAYLADPQGDRVDNGDASNGSNNDVIRAGDGDDTVQSGSGNDDVRGDAGNDKLLGADGSDSLYGGAGNDALFGGTSDDLLSGSDGRDTFSGGAGNDALFGGADADVFLVADDHNGETVVGGETTTAGGEDNDILSLDFADVLSITYGGGTDESGTVTFVDGGTLTFSEIENVVFRGPVDGKPFGEVMLVGYTDVNGDQIDGSDGLDDTIFGNGGDDYIESGFGNDTVFGGVGNDIIHTVAGNDVAYGDKGNDFLWMDEVNDTVAGTNDTAYGGLGNDTVFGRYGDDLIYGGTGDDDLHGGSGADTVYGEEGDDGLHGGNDMVADSFYGGAGNDTLQGDQGNDSLYGGEGNDQAYGGDEDDLAEGGEGQDTFFGDAGNDVLVGGAGDDEQFGGAGNDRLDGGADRDSLYGDAGNDTLRGESGSDLLNGGLGNDSLDGGDNADVLIAEFGNDTLNGGDGADNMYGGDDRDTFITGIGDVVDGGEGGDDFDVLDLTAFGHPATNIIYDANNPENGTVEFLDANGVVVGTMTFSNIEDVVACFTPGSMVLTERGEVAIEDLMPGDRVMTHDNGYQVVRWAGRRDLTHAELIVEPRFNPVFIARGALGGGLPERDMRVSPQHRLLLSGPRAELLFGEYEVLVAARYLIGTPGIEQRIAKAVSYIHILFDKHEIVRADGVWSESFQPGDQTLDGLDGDSRAEILAIFPDLARGKSFESARLTLKAREARALLQA